jgi:hypothetical protein
MNRKQLLFGTTMIGLSLAIAGTGLASAHGRTFNGSRDTNSSRFEVQASIDSGDYSAWVQALQGHENLPFDLTEEVFLAFEEAHSLMEKGDREGAAEILEAAGINFPPHTRYGFGKGQVMNKGIGHGGSNQAVKEAIDNNDYNAWLEAISDTPMKNIANQEIFNKMVAIHDARKAGDREKAKELHRELHELIRSLKSN